MVYEFFQKRSCKPTAEGLLRLDGHLMWLMPISTYDLQICFSVRIFVDSWSSEVLLASSQCFAIH